jgi:hypothetical protein
MLESCHTYQGDLHPIIVQGIPQSLQQSLQTDVQDSLVMIKLFMHCVNLCELSSIHSWLLVHIRLRDSLTQIP